MITPYLQWIKIREVKKDHSRPSSKSLLVIFLKSTVLSTIMVWWDIECFLTVTYHLWRTRYCFPHADFHFVAMNSRTLCGAQLQTLISPMVSMCASSLCVFIGNNNNNYNFVVLVLKICLTTQASNSWSKIAVTKLILRFSYVFKFFTSRFREI